jgi:hypothetical protein
VLLKAAALAGLPLLVLGETSLVNGDDPDPTSIVEVVMYGVDDDTHELLRYSFRTNEYMVIGEIVDEYGNVVEKVESLGYIPNGPQKGLYGVTNYDGTTASRLVKFDVLDASVTAYPVDVGYGNVEGMVASWDSESGEWGLYATQTGDVHGIGNGNANGQGHGNGNGNNNGTIKHAICHFPPGNTANVHTIWVAEPALSAHIDNHPGDALAENSCGGTETVSNRNLIKIDPATGLGEMVMQLTPKFEGLAQGPDGVLYAAADDELWAIDLYLGTKVEIGVYAYDDVEALEYAHGDYDPQVEVPGVPAAWTANGVLFGFSDHDNAVLIFDPATGNAVEYECALDTTGSEGMVFMTEMHDPYTWIVALPCD